MVGKFTYNDNTIIGSHESQMIRQTIFRLLIFLFSVLQMTWRRKSVNFSTTDLL